MRPLPLADPGEPDTRSAPRFLIWTGRHQWRTLLGGAAFGTLWMVAQAVMPYVIGRGIDEGAVTGDLGATAGWAAVVLGLGTVQAASGVMRHRFAVSNWLQATYRVTQVISRHVAHAGQALARRVTTGEVVSTVASDAVHIGGMFDITARLTGAIVSFFAVTAIVLSTSVPLGLLVLVGTPLLAATLTPIVRPLQSRQQAQRAGLGQLTALGADTVAGLRVLRGIGGEAQFLGRYRAQSQEVRVLGVRLATTRALLDAMQVLLPGAFLVSLTWLGARLALAGDISPGDLVAFYGYAFFLVFPLRTVSEAADRATRALVGARRVLDVLHVERDVTDRGRPVAEPPAGVDLVDIASGLVVRSGRLTGLVSTPPEHAVALADRLGRFVDDGDVSLGGVRLVDLPVATLRRRVLVSETEPRLFSGSLRECLDPWGRATADSQLLEALHIAAAEDVLDALPDGLDSLVEERGRSLSGGQRQRLVLARALLANPEVLLLVEPTSAVDAHTEARIADRLRTAREGRTTVVVTSSPLMLDRADVVAWIEEGTVVAEGTHRELLATVPAYRETVTRGEDR